MVGVLKNGDGPVVMLRSELDALPLEEQSTQRMMDQFDIERPVMHACGHDMHLTCLLAASELTTPSTVFLDTLKDTFCVIVVLGSLRVGADGFSIEFWSSVCRCDFSCSFVNYTSGQ